MDGTTSLQCVNPILAFVLSKGGKYWPEIGAYNIPGWVILADVSDDTIRDRLEKYNVPVKRLGGEVWVTPLDFWGCIPKVGYKDAEPCLRKAPEKPPAGRKGKGRSTK